VLTVGGAPLIAEAVEVLSFHDLMALSGGGGGSFE